MHASFEELLSVYQIDERLIPALSLQLEFTFKALNEVNIQHAKGFKEGLAKLDEKLEQLQERFAFGHITQELYEKFSAKLLAERQPLKAELEKVDDRLSNLSQYIKKSLLIASKPGEYWKEGDYNTKEKLQY
jgi:ABC-type phosphate transport system auxiliary subunit